MCEEGEGEGGMRQPLVTWKKRKTSGVIIHKDIEGNYF